MYDGDNLLDGAGKIGLAADDGIQDSVVIGRGEYLLGGRWEISWDENGGDWPVGTEKMEILEIQRIIQNLFQIFQQRVFFPYLEFETEDNASEKEYDIDTLAHSRDGILEDDVGILIGPGLQDILHDANFAFPGLIRRCLVNPVISHHNLTENLGRTAGKELGKGCKV